ncbi:MAG TPA: arginine deiminase family protein [Chthoniobacterales bacterium]
MQLNAITREVSPSINQCELSFHSRAPIDVDKARAQHKEYETCLRGLGVKIHSLPAEPNLPDSVFVEDAALVFDELAVLPIMGASSRRPEITSLAETIARFRPINYLVAPGTLDGGDVLRAGKRVFVGLTKRTNAEAIDQLRNLLRPHGYTVDPVDVHNVLHLKSACSYIGNNTLLINRNLLNPDFFCEFELIDVPSQEPAAANALMINDVVIIPTSFPTTCTLLEAAGFAVRTLDISELQKAEAGVTCCSLIFGTKE